MQDIIDLITENWKIINENIENTCFRYKMPRPEILGATKFQDMKKIEIASKLGLTLIGENRVQEFLEKFDGYPKNLTKDFIGVLQSNKIPAVVGKVRYIHSCDSIKSVNEISRQAQKKNIVQEILLQINIASESTKSGVKPDETADFLSFSKDLPNIKTVGLMVIPPPNQEEKYFEKAQILFNDFKAQYNLSVLSQGMSDSYTEAIKYGSTLVRIGSCLFGYR